MRRKLWWTISATATSLVVLGLVLLLTRFTNLYETTSPNKTGSDATARTPGSAETLERIVEDHAPTARNQSPAASADQFPATNPESMENQDQSIEELYLALTELTDPMDKRIMRERISDIEPASTTLAFLLEQLSLTDDADQKTQIYSIITLMNAATIVDTARELASRTRDEELFLSLVYSLRQANTADAKKTLLGLMVDNQLPSSKNDTSPLKNQGMVGLYRALMDTLNVADIPWLKTYVESHNLSDAQRLVVDAFIRNRAESEDAKRIQ